MDFCDAICIAALCQLKLTINNKALVKPVLDYAATVWSPYTQKDIDMVE